MKPKIRRGRPLKPLELTPEEREKLQMVANRPKTAQRDAMRAKIILLADKGKGGQEIAQRLGITMQTVSKWRNRFLDLRLEGLSDELRSGAPRTVTDADVEKVVTLTLETTPRGQTHWSQRSMAKKVGLSQPTIHRIWRAFGLQPHLSRKFKLSPDPMFVEKVRDIVGLYMTPPEHAIVLCLDEKSQIQALNRTQPILPLRPGIPEKQTHDYQRNGTTTLFAALNAHTGEVIRKCYRSHRAKEFIRFLNLVDSQISPDVKSIHIIADNYATHKTPAVKRWFARHPRYVIHFTPTYSSWLNLVERLFAEITEKAIRRGSFQSVRALEAAIRDYLDSRENKPFVWSASADEIFAKISRFCLRTSVSGH